MFHEIAITPFTSEFYKKSSMVTFSDGAHMSVKTFFQSWLQLAIVLVAFTKSVQGSGGTRTYLL